MVLSAFVCLLVNRITHKLLEGLPRNLVEGCGMGQGRSQYILFHILVRK